MRIASVLLGLIKNVDRFHPDVKDIAESIRSDIRNPWAHCDFTQWNTTRYLQSFSLMENLIQNVSLSTFDEKQTLDQLVLWKSNGNINAV
ncbi:Hypothetical predicted protein [Mytilus galloprovincialis]|uniref:Uncharacterized protein n=1 Tax=Mytilus galloprovincialis TaxID=29158 RepID=A0A8B6DUM0_MYTGA|nr:Hypothetical predicted protein [Mytilus galloprovincialis]